MSISGSLSDRHPDSQMAEPPTRLIGGTDQHTSKGHGIRYLWPDRFGERTRKSQQNSFTKGTPRKNLSSHRRTSQQLRQSLHSHSTHNCQTALHHECLHRPNSPSDHQARVHGTFARPCNQLSNLQPFRYAPLRGSRSLEIGENGTLQPGLPVLYYQPFNTTDLLNWKQHTMPYSEKPQVMIDLLESIFQTHQLTWDDCHKLLLTLFNTEE
ncbi:uncharacterized protein LOC120597034 [Pteropus medius]|uniref:uncharacterized protein LOC120597034 n=1 Tax=Pteropus vampyrus TaxID=132908 RepID=UPI00196A7D2D|nr:uncharacterized protein LOC120597034 [Pteropus giganteus]